MNTSRGHHRSPRDSRSALCWLHTDSTPLVFRTGLYAATTRSVTPRPWYLVHVQRPSPSGSSPLLVTRCAALLMLHKLTPPYCSLGDTCPSPQFLKYAVDMCSASNHPLVLSSSRSAVGTPFQCTLHSVNPITSTLCSFIKLNTALFLLSRASKGNPPTFITTTRNTLGANLSIELPHSPTSEAVPRLSVPVALSSEF